MSDVDTLEFTAHVVGALCVARAVRTRLGVFVENLPPMSTSALVEAVAKAATAHGLGTIRLALLGGSNGVPKRKKGPLELTTDPLVANQWRNDAEARAGVRMITVVLGPTNKVNSLRTALRPIGVKDLREEVARVAQGWLDSAERRGFWRALVARSREVPTGRLLEYAAGLASLAHRSAALLDAEPATVYRLGLLQSEALTTTSGLAQARRALEANLEIVASLADLSDKHRKHLIRLADDPEHQRVAQAVLRFAETQSPDELKSLSVEAVRETLRATPQIVAPEVEEDEDEADDHDAAPPRPPSLRVEGDILAVDLLLGGGRGAKVAAERFAKALEPDEDGAIDGAEFKVGDRTVDPQPREGTTQSAELFGPLLDEETWGGLVLAPEAADLVSAARMAAAGDAQIVKFKIADENHVRGMLARGVDVALVPAEALAALDRYAAHRARLLPARHALLDHPLLAVAGNPKLADAVAGLLTAYDEALRAVQEASNALIQSGSVEPGRRLIARMLCLDVVFVHVEGEWQAVAAPTHPFHLWRVNALLEIFHEHLDELKEIGEDALKEVIADPHTISPHVVLSPYAVNDGEVSHAQTLTSAGSFGALPMFADPQGRQGGRFRVLALAPLAERMMRLMPHAAMGLRVTLVDPPSVAGALERLVALGSPLDEESVVPLHATVLRTRVTQEATDEEDEKLATIAKDLVDAGGSLMVRPNLPSLEAVAEHLKEHPAHLTAIFDPGEARVVRLSAVRPPPLSPLTLPRSYHYDAFDDRIDVVVSGDVPLFSTYHDLFCKTIDVPTTDLLGRRSGASHSGGALERVLQHTVWLSVVDQGIEPTFRVRSAERLDWRQDAGRDVVTLTAHPDTIEALIRDAVRVAGLPATEERVKQTQRELFELSGEAILTLLRPRPQLSLAEPRFAKGLMGVLAAARGYQRVYPNSLVISLDDPVSRRWILGYDANSQHGDLLAIRSTESGPALEAIEVKTHEDVSGAVTLKKTTIEGRAVVQVDQTIRILRAVLGASGSAVASARKDILRDQLYRAVAARTYSAADRRRFVNMLDELFERGPSETQGLIFAVRIAAGESAQLPSAPDYRRSPEGNLVGLVELVESGERRRTPPPSPPSSSGQGPSGGDDRSPPKPKGAKARAARAGKGEGATMQAHVVETTPPPTGATKSPEPTDAERLRVFIGKSPTEVDVHWDPHDPDRPLNNFGFLITGDSGAGKTQMLRALVHEVAAAGIPVCIFDYKNDYADPTFSGRVGLEVYDVNRQGLPFNPLELVPEPDGRIQPIRQIHELAQILGRVFGLGDQMEAQLRNAMKDAYEAHGIEHKAWITPSEAPEPPSFDEVVERLRHDDKNEKLLNRLSPLFDLDLFPASTGAATSFEDLLQRRVVLLLNGLPNDKIKQAIAEFIIVRLHSYVLRGQQPRKLRRLLVFDEAWRVKDSVRLQELAREGRAFGVGIAIGTQFPGDLPDSLTGNLATQLMLLNTSSEHRRSVIRALVGTTSGRDAQALEVKLRALQKHEGFFRNQQYTPYILVLTQPHYERVGKR
ncbi:MAG: hypothetical protein IT378_15670 [Sandaracinaceae bacterium]|nr:hypothetical protein [Sandaracinaceae bacterium]